MSDDKPKTNEIKANLEKGLNSKPVMCRDGLTASASRSAGPSVGAGKKLRASVPASPSKGAGSKAQSEN